MFEALDSIDWSQVASCYGQSEKIPAAIRGLVSEDTTMRETAQGTLRMALEHQGSVYEAAALAVPFLLAILADPQTQDKRQLVHLLAHLGCRGRYLGNWYQRLDTRLPLQSKHNALTLQFFAGNGESGVSEILQSTRDALALHLEQRKKNEQETRDRYRRWDEDTYQAFREGLPLFLSLLSNPDPHIRQEIAFLLATFSADRSKLLPSLMTQLQAEQDEHVQCSLLLCLGHLLEPTPDASQLLLHYLEEGETTLLQFSAARALCTLFKERPPEQVVQVLFEVFMHPYALQPSFQHLSPLWGSGWIHARALYYLDKLTASPYQTLIMERLIELFPTLDGRADLDCADLLVRVAFYEKQFRLQPQTTFDDLDPMQQTVLRTLVAKEALWVGDSPRWNEIIQLPVNSPPAAVALWNKISQAPVHPPSVGALVRVGLPATRQGLQAFIATTTR